MTCDICAERAKYEGSTGVTTVDQYRADMRRKLRPLVCGECKGTRMLFRVRVTFCPHGNTVKTMMGTAAECVRFRDFWANNNGIRPDMPDTREVTLVPCTYCTGIEHRHSRHAQKIVRRGTPL